METWLIVLIVLLSISSIVYVIRSSSVCESNVYEPSSNDKDHLAIIENFGFEDDKGGSWELVKSGLDGGGDCWAMVGSGDGVRDMFDFSDRFITAQIEASNDIPIIERRQGECK